MDDKVIRLRESLLEWGEQAIKEYPWRYMDDPYSVLVSEFMLHRTQTRQAEAVFREFMQEYPSLAVYAQSDREEAREILEPLGLNWRIDGMLGVLDSLWDTRGEVPPERGALIKEKNVGQYIAGATATFTKNEPHALVDTNTVRVVGRVFGLDLRGEARRRKEVIEAIGNACDPERPRDFYYAMIDLAHEICTPKEPDCQNCPLLDVPCALGQERVKQA